MKSTYLNMLIKACMPTVKDTKGMYYSNLIKDMDEHQAVNFAITKVREATDEIRKTNEHLEKALDLMEAQHLSR